MTPRAAPIYVHLRAGYVWADFGTAEEIWIFRQGRASVRVPLVWAADAAELAHILCGIVGSEGWDLALRIFEVWGAWYAREGDPASPGTSTLREMMRGLP
jgi:hypothetical protein